jgi:diguanylate cyclase (GGDEF)-like protein
MHSITSLKVLVVDDDEDDLYLIKEALHEVERTAYKITTASSTLTAMVALAKDTFDVIFSDYRLGAVTGVDFINSVRAAGIDTPIILLTGISDHLVDTAALKAGSSDFIPKTSINADVLDRSVRYSLAHANRQRLMQSILKNTRTAIAVVTADGTETLSNAQMLNFARLAFGYEAGAKDRLIATALASKEKDIVFEAVILESHMTPLPDGGSLLALHDVTDRVNDLRQRELAEERIRNIAMHDGLTGLPNRMAFNIYLDDCLTKAKRSASNIAVLLFDFNRFKEVNDLFGHAAGDHILTRAAETLRTILTEHEYCARLGGDEFVLIQYDSNTERALELAQRVVSNLSVPLKWQDRTLEASVTLGLTLYPLHGKNRQELLANADIAMYRGKSELDRTICVFDASMDQYIRDRRSLAHDLRHAIQNGELSLNLQPQFVSATGMLSGFEALLRWHCSTRGLISPSVFIPVAEDNGLIIEIDNWVLLEACNLLKQHDWIPRIAINVSAKAICQPHIVAQVRDALLKFGISPNRLELEITETALIHDLNRAIHNLRQIKALGISVAMDDFGTGYSSLSLLNSFPFDRIKVDGSFIQMTGGNVRAGAIFKTVISLGLALNVPVLAEGVETEQQLQFARDAGCEELQGFHFGRPIPDSALADMFVDVGGNVCLDSLQKWQDGETHFDLPFVETENAAIATVG